MASKLTLPEILPKDEAEDYPVEGTPLVSVILSTLHHTLMPRSLQFVRLPLGS